MKCVKCDTEIGEAKFCPICGATQLIQPPPTNYNINVQNTVQQEPIINSQPNINPQLEISVEPQVDNNPQTDSLNVINSEEQVRKNNMIFYIISGIIAVIVIGVFIWILIQYFNPKIEIKGIKQEYNYSEISGLTFKAEGNMFIQDKNTEWIINGYKYASGNNVKNIPVNIGDNTITINNKGATSTYYFEVINDTSLLTEGNFTITSDYLDFDNDGISNKVEEEKGLSSYKNDTDNDGLYDNVELIMELDPTKKDDYDVSREYKVIQNNYKGSKNYLIVTSKGNVANTFLDTVDINVGFSSKFIVSDTLKVTTTNIETPDSMTIYFNKDKDWTKKEYSVYMFDEATSKITELNTKENEDYLIANITKFDNIYFIGKKSEKPKEYLNQIIILIDNSGSMFTSEYVAGVSKPNDTSYAHDVEFKRLSLMTELVDQLGTENYEYSVYAFTASHCEMVKYSNDPLTIKKGINSLRTSCQKFNGTDMSGAIKKYANTFKDDVYGAKYMIVLTDGKDTGDREFALSEYYLNNYRKQGIHIITLGLSSEVNSDYLMDIAYLTKGKYLYASDANMLDTLSGLIESSIHQSQDTVKFNDKEYTLVADSGFQVDKDGFSFKNFGTSEQNNSNSFGFSYLAKQIYLNKIYDENGKSDIVTSKLSEENNERLVKGNTYNIKLNDEYNKLIENKEDINITKINNGDDDYQLIKIINNAFNVQNKIFIKKANDFILKHFQNQYYDYDTNLTKMIDELQSGSPAILSLSSATGTHSVLATKIYKAIGGDEYVITVYDSNMPGTEGKIYLTRSTAYYQYADSSFYSVKYNEYDIEFTNMLYVDQY